MLSTLARFSLGIVSFAALAYGADLDQPQPYRAARVSSNDPEGRNADAVRLEARSNRTVADIRGPGRIVHMWFTLGTAEPDYLRTTRLKIYWDGKPQPAVDVPFGDFHCLGHCRIRMVNSALVSVEARPHLNRNLGNPNLGGFNSYFPMPFAEGARVVIDNNSDHPVTGLFWQIDYQKWDLAPSPLRFHAWYHVSPAEPFAGEEFGRDDQRNPDGRDNHVVLDISGRGHFVGIVLSVDAAGKGWWEGDELIWIDGEARPSIAGTGTEDYFGGAWGFRTERNAPYNGVTVLEKVAARPDWQAGLYTMYRFHKQDPIPFTRSFKMSIERGHNNYRRDSKYESVAFWYQR